MAEVEARSGIKVSSTACTSIELSPRGPTICQRCWRLADVETGATLKRTRPFWSPTNGKVGTAHRVLLEGSAYIPPGAPTVRPSPRTDGWVVALSVLRGSRNADGGAAAHARRKSRRP
jgi:hypothetical protein